MLKRRSVLILLVALYAVIVCSLAGAAEPPVTFVDQQPRELKVSDLKPKGLAVTLHNELGRKQKLFLKIFGQRKSDKTALKKLFSPLGVSTTGQVKPNKFKELTLPLADKATEVHGGAVKAVLIASAEARGVDRVPVTIELEKKAPLPETADKEGNVLRPDRPVDLTIEAINTWPSPASSSGSLLLFLAIVAGCLVYILRKKLKETIDQDGYVFVWLLIAVALVASLLMLRDGSVWDQPSEQHIEVRPIGVSAAVSKGKTGDVNVGTLSGSDGALVQLVVKENRLTPVGLDGAGTYSGTYDLEPDAEKKGESKATINVRDFWLYALLALLLGLLIAYLLHRWVERTRPAAKLERSREVMESDYRAAKESFEADAPYFPAPAFHPHFARLRDESEDKLDENEAKAARDAAEKVRTVLDHYLRLLVALSGLGSACRELEKLHRLNPLGVEIDDVDAYAVALEQLREASNRAGAEDDTELKSRRTELETTLRWVREVVNQYKSILRQLAVTEKLLREKSKFTAELQSLEAKLRELGVRTLQAKTEELGKIDEEDDRALEKLLEIEAKMPEGETALELIGDEELICSGVEPAALRSLVRQQLNNVQARRSKAPTPRLELAWRGAKSKSFKTKKVYREEMVEFQIQVFNPLGFNRVIVDFGDGDSRAFPVTGEASQTLNPPHFYKVGGRKLTVSCASPDGTVSTSATIEVDSETRSERSKKELSEGDRAVAVAAFVLALATGMGTQYFADSSWGEPKDYLAALAWGGLVGEGVKVAAGLAKRVLPSG